MRLPAASVRRPIFTVMVTLMVVAMGAVALSRLRIDMLPEVELPSCTIRTEYEGASPEVVERLVTQIVEEIVATVPGVEEIESTSSEGSSRVTVRLAWGIDLDEAAIELQSRLEQEIDELPEDVGRPRVSKFDIASFPVVILGISSKLDPVALTEIVEDQVRFRFARIPGVAQVDVWGGYPREVRVELDPGRVNALGIPLDRVLDALRDANLDRPAGKLEDGRQELTLRAPAEYESLDEIRDTVVLELGDGAVTIGQIARVVDTYERLDRHVRVNGDLGLRVAVRKQADANTVEVSRAILEEIQAVNRAFPQINVVAVSNQGGFIERSIRNVSNSVLYGGAFAALVLLLFLRSLRSTLVITAAIPVSVVATFALMYQQGLTLNLMTLGGLALGVGMMVDSSVVVLENVFRRRTEDGDAPEVAAVRGTGEVAGAIIASTITTLVIFVPLVFVRGVSGLLFKELALVIAFSLACSLFVSLTLVPMLSARLLGKVGTSEPRGVLARAAGAFLSLLDACYFGLLKRVLRAPLVVAVGASALLGSSLLLYPYIGSEFLPPSDEGEVRVNGEMENGTRLDIVDAQTRIIEERVRELVPEAIATVTSVGPGWFSAISARGEVQITLSPRRERERSNSEVAASLREALGGTIAGMKIRTRAPQGQFLLQRVLGSDEGLEVEVRGYDLGVLSGLADHAADVIASVPGVTDVEVAVQAGVPETELSVDRRKVADVGLSVRDVTRVLETGFAGSRAGEYRSDGNSYRILVRLEDAERRSIDEVLDMTLSTPTGQPVALRNLVTASSGSGPLIIERTDQERTVKITANVAGRAQGDVARDVQVKLDEIPRPMGHDLSVAGAYEEQERSTRELLISFLLAIALVYMVLACQYESLRDPLIVMLAVPMAAVGVLATLYLTETTFNIQSAIGCIMLGGIVVNNAILLVDQAGRLVGEGMDATTAAFEAGRRRLRPILMTSLTTVLALLPLALGIGEGADAQAPLARAVVGGLVGSSAITLLLIPAVFALVHRDSALAAASA